MRKASILVDGCTYVASENANCNLRGPALARHTRQFSRAFELRNNFGKLKASSWLRLMFSVEIYEIILTSLQSNTETLLACSLVSQTFAALSQKHLFNTIILGHRMEPAPLAIKFHHILQSAPHLATLVQRLKIAEPPGGFAVDPGSPFVGLTNNHIALASILPLLTNLHELTFDGEGPDCTRTQWEAIPLALQKSLISSICLPCLTHLELCGFCNFPFSSTRFSPSLTNLYLDFVTFAQNTPSASPDHDRADFHPKLDTLTVELGTPAFRLLVETLINPSSPTAVSRLRSMSIFQPLDLDSYHPMQTLFTHISASLEELTLVPRFARAGWSPPAAGSIPMIQFHVLSRLQTLMMIVSIRRDGSSLPGVIELLEDLASSNIKEIIMECDCSDDSPTVDVQAQWTLVDRAGAILESVQSISLRFRSNSVTPRKGALESFISTTEASLSRLRQKGVLRIENIQPPQPAATAQRQ